MAARRVSGVGVIAVSLAATSVALGVLVLWLWEERGRADEAAATALKERDQARQLHTAAQGRIAALRQRLNRQTEIEFADLLAAIDDDLHRFGADTPNATYAEVVRRMQVLIDAARSELRQVETDKRRLEQEYAALESIKQVAVNESASFAQEARKEMIEQRMEIDKKIAGKDNEIAAIMDRANTLASKLETEQRDKTKVREELLGQVNKLRKILIEARAPYTPDALARQTPDGKVVRSSAASKTAWINIGSQDGVQLQLTFSVQPAGFSGNPFTKPKAKIEVISIAGPDLSEARIVESTPTNPIIEGDLIFNPAWNPGKVMRFALAGLLDIDGDGRDDRQLVRRLIENTGAKIDAEILPDGSIRGEVTVETNYFIRGVRPDADKGTALEVKVAQAMAKMERTSLDYGAVVIDLAKFLDLMGYSSPDRGRSAASSRLAPGDKPAKQGF